MTQTVLLIRKSSSLAFQNLFGLDNLTDGSFTTKLKVTVNLSSSTATFKWKKKIILWISLVMHILQLEFHWILCYWWALLFWFNITISKSHFFETNSLQPKQAQKSHLLLRKTPSCSHLGTQRAGLWQFDFQCHKLSFFTM